MNTPKTKKTQMVTQYKIEGNMVVN